VGADQIVNIEIDEGTRVAQQIISPDVLDLIPISDVVSLREVAVPAGFVGKSLKDLDLRNRMKVGIVAIRRFLIGIDEGGNTVREEQVVFPNADEVLEEMDVLIIVGMNESIDLFKDL
jgi:trk system potassium uptake protein TrkA